MRPSIFLTLLLLPALLWGQSDSTNTLALQGIRILNATQINTEHMEFAPTLHRDQLVYVTSREKFGPRDPRSGETFYQLYAAALDPNQLPEKPKAFSRELNSRLHENAVAFDRQGQVIYFTRSNLSGGLSKTNAQGEVVLKIYSAQKGPYDWENIEELPFNDDAFSCMHPTLTPDGKKLFFASDQSGGFGGYDLYFVEKDSNSWSKPINLGPEINTPEDEVFPFYHDSGALFFASKGHPGLGGMDLFMIDISENQWGRVTNLGSPLNTEADDLSLFLRDDGRRGYFASDREGGMGKSDIYFFESLGALPDSPVAQQEEEEDAPEEAVAGESMTLDSAGSTTIAILDESTGKTIAGAAVRIYEENGAEGSGSTALYNVELVPTQDTSGNFRLKIVRKQEAELGLPKVVTNRYGESNIQLEPGKEYLILVSKPGYKTREFRYRVPQDGSGGELMADGTVAPATEGDEDEPLRVSLEPSNCLDLRGTVLEKGYGREISDATVRLINECNGEVDVVSSRIDGSFEYCLEIGCRYTLIGEKPGYETGTAEVSTVRLRGNRTLTVELLLGGSGAVAGAGQPLREGSVIFIEDIFYDFDQYRIRSREASALRAMAMLMRQYPSMEIELSAHTDSRGPEDYNLRLSLRRAESAKDFLVREGIAGRRIRVFGYGESRLRNACGDGVDCSEAQHQRNRRTEVKITRMNESLEISQLKEDLKGFRGE